MKIILTIITILISSISICAPFKEFPIGEEVVKNHMIIAAVYLPPVTMDHEMKHEDHNLLKHQDTFQIHLEADIHATKENPQGFGAGEWIPYLNVDYKLTNKKSKETISGTFSPMVAKDGPHYGATVILPAKGEYELFFTINPPQSKDFGRHADKVTGVAPWWAPFKVSYKFNFNGFE